MYRIILTRKLRQVFESINAGDYGPAQAAFRQGSAHWFSGTHALGGERSTLEDIAKWYERLGRLFPDLTFEIKNIGVSGWPWNAIATVEWVGHLSDRNGTQYSNIGVHILKFSGNVAKSLHIYCDTKLLEEVLGALHEQGVEEASAQPIST